MISSVPAPPACDVFWRVFRLPLWHPPPPFRPEKRVRTRLSAFERRVESGWSAVILARERGAVVLHIKPPHLEWLGADLLIVKLHQRDLVKEPIRARLICGDGAGAAQRATAREGCHMAIARDGKRRNVTISMSAEEEELIDILAKRHSLRSRSEVIRTALDSYKYMMVAVPIDEDEGQRKNALRDNARR
jgi:Arc/MetJ-type ribon-helix-helix transcriptional regulator